MAVPGSVRVRSAEGTNDLLADGAPPVRDAGDVLVALGLDHRRAHPAPRRREPDGLEGRLLELLDELPAGLGELVEQSGDALSEVAMALGRLEASGWVLASGGWFERSHVSRLLP
jgi:predicted Rossmann fold nucleotide-binding protein DprA/Smf involved in DNA uptake